MSAARIGLTLTLLLVPAAARAELHTSCPTTTPPDCQDEECACTPDGEPGQISGSGADPVDFRYGETIFKRTDLVLKSGNGDFKFVRSFSNSVDAWNPGSIYNT